MLLSMSVPGCFGGLWMLTQLLVWQVLWDETSLKDPQALVAT
jgi:hypothetical protein